MFGDAPPHGAIGLPDFEHAREAAQIGGIDLLDLIGDSHHRHGIGLKQVIECGFAQHLAGRGIVGGQQILG